MQSLQSSSANEVALDSRISAKAILIRSVEQRLLTLFSEGKLFGTVHTCIGQEWTGIAIAEALRPGDCILSNHRGHGHFLAWTDNVEGLISEIMGKQSGVCGGRGGSQHIHAEGFYSNGIQGGMTPVAAGLALAQKLHNSESVTAVFIGDGTLGEGVLYESLNIASKWDLPVLFALENNLYAQSTSQTQTLAGGICDRASAFGIRPFVANTWETDALLETTQECVDYIRSASRPAFLRMDTYRLMAHSKGDDDRDKEEVQRYWAKDPLVALEQSFPALTEELKQSISRRIDAAVAAADDEPFAQASESDEDTVHFAQVAWTSTNIATPERMTVLLHASFERNMRRDPRIILVGEDIEGPYGGAFKVTRDLSLQFPGRVRNTPISEAAITGIGNGLALSGMLPVCEIMFGDFITLTADQFINHAAKFRYMFNDQVQVPLILRTPMGGKRGYGATHSQSLEKHFLGVPGTRVLALHHRYDPGLIYDKLFQTIDRPTLVIENKALYASRITADAPDGFAMEHTDELFPTTRLRPGVAPDITVFCYGGMFPDAERASEQLFADHDIVCEVICPTQLYPFNSVPVANSVSVSGRLLIVEEGQAFAALGAEVISSLVEGTSGFCPRVKRLSAPRHPIPSCGPLEKSLLPGVAQIVNAGLELMSE